MIIQKIELFSTPLTPDYRNVYDDYNSSTDYVNFLKENFLYEVFNRPTDSSRKEKNGELDIVLHGLHTDAVRLHDYNYVAIYTTHGGQGDVIKFAFVIDMESVNDTVDVGQNGSIKIHVKMDSWANHYLNIKYAYNSIVENRCTFDTAVWRNYPSKLKTNLFSEKVSYEGILPVGISGNSTYPCAVALWQRVYLTDIAYLDYNRDNEVNNDYVFDGYPTVYNFVGIIYYDEDKGFNLLYKTVNISYLSYTQIGRRTITTHSPRFHFMKSSFVSNSTLTVNVPFLYDIDYDPINDSFNIDISSNTRVLYSNRLYNKNVVVQDASDYEIGSGNFFTLFVGSSLDYDNGYRVEKFTNINPSPLAISFASNLRYDINFKPQYEQIFNEYPFNYKSINYGKSSFPIIGAMGENKNFYLHYDCSMQSTAHVSFTDINDNTVQFPLTNNQGQPISEIPIDEYLMRNSGNINNQIVQMLLSTVVLASSSTMKIGTSVLTGNALLGMSGVTDAIRGVTNIGSTISNINNTLYDLNRTPATLRDTDSNAFSSVLPSDTLSIKRHSAYNPDKVIEDYHYNGYECYYMGKVTEKRRDVFDVDCGVADIACPMSKDDKEELLSAFSRGVTRWHIGENNADRKAILTAMNKNVLNYPISLIP